MLSRPPLHILMPSRDLQYVAYVELLRTCGYHWARRVYLPWADSLRNPTVGCVLELSRRAETGMVDIESVEARRWAAIIVGR
jgi:hypothetical protein